MALVISSSTLAQEQKSSDPVSDALTATPKLILGLYRGDVAANNGQNAFEIIITRVEGKNFSGSGNFNKGHVSCQLKSFPFTGTIGEDGVVKIDATKTLLGCEREFDLKLMAEGRLQGKLKGPQGNYDVNLVKQK